MLVKRQRWLHGKQVIYLLGLVELKGKETPEQIAKLESLALDNLSHNAERWGIRKVRRSTEPTAKAAYPESDVFAYMDRCEKADDERMRKR